MADQTKVIIPNGETGQQFQVQPKFLSGSFTLQSTDKLVTNPGKKEEKSLTIAEHNNTSIQVNLPIETPEQQKAAIAQYPFLAQVLPLLTAEVTKKYS